MITDPALPTVLGLYPLPFHAVVPISERVRVEGRWLEGVDGSKTMLEEATLIHLRSLHLQASDPGGAVRILLTELGIGKKAYLETPANSLDPKQGRGLDVTRGLVWVFPEPLPLIVSQSWWLQLYNVGCYQRVVSGCLWASLPPKTSQWAKADALSRYVKAGDLE